MATKTIVLFCGTAGAGKDTAADILCASAGGVKMAYADPLKTAVAAILGIPNRILYGSQADKETYKAYDKTARHWLQWLGTDVCRRMIHPDLWVHRFAERVLASQSSLIVNSDCRFRNEMDCLRDSLLLESVSGTIKLITVKIINPRVQVDLTHQSESEIYHLPSSVFDYVVMNDGSIDDLKVRLKTLEATHLSKVVDDSGGSLL